MSDASGSAPELRISSGGYKILRDLARDMRLVAGPAVGYSAQILVGAQRLPMFPDRSDGAPIAIGIQTEHILDAEGTRMWAHFPKARVSGMVERYDFVVDLAEANRPAYDFLPASERRKLIFGPYIFPQIAPTPRPGDGGLLFIGGSNARRKALLDQLGGGVSHVPEGTFGKELDQIIAGATGLLNLHTADGVYTEYPRLLKAVRAGKAVWSEALAPPLVAGEHYFPLTATPDRDEIARCAAAMAEFLCGNYSVQALLRRVGGMLGAER